MNLARNNSTGSTQSVFLESGSFQSITLGNLRLAPFTVEKVLDVQIKQQINEHGTLFIKAMLPEGVEERDIEALSEHKTVALLTGEQIIFQGIAQEVEAIMVDHVYYLEIKAISYSYLLDIAPVSCSFQNKKMTYHQLVSQVTTKYPNASFIDTASNGKTTNQFIMAYKETDWQFLKRLASHFNTGLICDTRFDSPKYFFGLPNQGVIDLESFNYKAKKDLKRYKYLKESGMSGLSENDFICYEVWTNQIIQTGDRVRFKGVAYHVGNVVSQIKQGIFLSSCLLTTSQGLSQPYKPHDEIAGCSFNGRIIDIQNDRVKVHLDIDPSQSVADAHFFPYSTPYSSKDGSGWYAMPNMSDNVRIYFPDDDDSHAYAISSVHEPTTPAPTAQTSGGSGGSGGMNQGGAAPPPSGAARDNPDIKSLRHPSGKEITLTEEGIYIVDGTSSITMTEEGVVIQSEKDIEFKSDKDIIMSAEKKVQIVAQETVEICAGDTAKITLEENVEIQGQEVKSN